MDTSRFTIDGTSYLCAGQFFEAKNASSVTTTRFRISCVCPTPSFIRNKDPRCAISTQSCGNTSEKHIILVGSYAKFTQNAVIRQHLLGTGDRLLTEASPYDTWGIGYRADRENAICPPAWRGLNLFGKALQIVRQHIRDRAPPPVRHHHTSPTRGDSTAQGRDYNFEVDPSSQQCLPTYDMAIAPAGYSAFSLNVPPDHGGDVLSVTTAAGHMAQNAQSIAEQGPCLVSSIGSMDNS